MPTTSRQSPATRRPFGRVGDGVDTARLPWESAGGGDSAAGTWPGRAVPMMVTATRARAAHKYSRDSRTVDTCISDDARNHRSTHHNTVRCFWNGHTPAIPPRPARTGAPPPCRARQSKSQGRFERLAPPPMICFATNPTATAYPVSASATKHVAPPTHGAAPRPARPRAAFQLRDRSGRVVLLRPCCCVWIIHGCIGCGSRFCTTTRHTRVVAAAALVPGRAPGIVVVLVAAVRGGVRCDC